MSDDINGLLLVEDDRVDVMTVQRALRKSPLASHLCVARSAVEALAILRGEGRGGIAALPALILLDLNLPHSEGIALLRALREDPRLRDLRVVVLSSSNDAADRAVALRYEVEDYLVKPQSFEEFKTAIKTLLAAMLPAQGIV